MRKLSNFIIEEGAWGYDPQQTDAALDLRAEIKMTILETIYDECFKRIWSNDEGIDLNGNSAWDAIAQIEYFFEKCSELSDVYNKEKDPEYEKYYYWWRLKRDKQKDIVDLYSEAISRCNGDEEFINSWKEPEQMKESLKKRTEILKRYADMRDAYLKKQISNDKHRVDDTINKVNDPNYSSDEKDAEVPEGKQVEENKK